MELLKIAICDDQKTYTDIIRELVASWAGKYKIEIDIKIESSGEKLLEQVKKDIHFNEHFDIILLDMKMGELNGIETAKRLRVLEPHAYIIFITSHFMEVVFDAFEVRAFRYIMKNRLEELLPKALDDVLQDRNQDRENNLLVSFNKTYMRIPIPDVIFFESNSRISTAHMIHAREIRFTMRVDELEEHLKGKGFIRCHQSFIVNSKYIRSIRNYTVFLSNNQEIPASRARYEQVKKEFAWSLR